MIYSPILTYVFGPQNFRWSKFRENIYIVDDSDVVGMTEKQLSQQRHEDELTSEGSFRLKRARTIAAVASIVNTSPSSFYRRIRLTLGTVFGRL